MELKTNDYIDHWLYTGDDFEPHITRILFKYLKRGDYVLDIGANIGYHSLVAAKIVGEKGKVECFEPSPLTIDRLKQNIVLNNQTNVVVHQKAVSNKREKIELKIPSEFVSNSGRASFRSLEENFRVCEVEAVLLDEYLVLDKAIKLVKMDIEGAEALALEGMTDLIDKMKPIFVLELTDQYLKQMGSSAQLVLEFFWKKNYNIYIAGEEVVALLPSTILTDHQNDILCLPNKGTFFE
jgi:FkbM family methyltransferase